MMRFKHFLLGRKGLNTVEVVIILAVILGIALLFRKEITSFVNDLIAAVFKPEIVQELDPTQTTPAATP